jgi:photosystem II stability/assembly factor-like uncharacterized protein
MRINYLLSKLYAAFFMLELLFNPAAISQTVEINSSTFGALEARHIGPAVMSGRITCIDALASDPRTVWVGSASGGLWKSVNGGVKFKPVFDEYTMSLGAVAITQSYPDTVWAGTGEPWPRNSVSVGTGIYKTTDNGVTWKNKGLKDSERIARIVIHPGDPNTVFVAALGHLWGPNEERGVFKTSDGGETWNKVLYVNENTGCADLAVNTKNPDILFAAMWEFRRKAYFFTSGGPGSGLYKSVDGGKNWTKLTSGLPERNLGRIAVGISPVNPDIVYALIEAANSGLYRSDDQGVTWKLVNKTLAMSERPFYFSQIYPDPVDAYRVYKPSYDLNVSEDGGEKFRTSYVDGGSVHVDHHAFWIAPGNNKILYLGTDGGLYISNDQGSSFLRANNLPVSQFYKVAVDMAKPYNIYGGLQDNGSWIGPSRSPNGIENSDWNYVGYGDGFSVLPDKEDPDIVYFQYQGGNYFRRHLSTGEAKLIKPFKDKTTEDLRFNWDAAITFSPADNTLYVGAQYLYKSSDRGDSWVRISPDLTTDDPLKQKQEQSGGITIDNSTAENHCTIVTIAESSLDKQIIWVGTDDGNVQVTQDGGKNWTNVTGNFVGLPPNTWCTSVCPGHFDKNTCYVTFDGHRNDNKTPYVYKTTDCGKSWTSLADKNISSYCYKIIEDLVTPNLLFLGTEFGLFISVDGGTEWAQMKGNLPNVSVMDLVIHPREHDLVLGTHGRGIIILDDITPLRQLTAEILDSELVFLDSRPYALRSYGGRSSEVNDDEFVGRNPGNALNIVYYLKKRHIFGDMSVEIYDSQGNNIKTLPAGKRKGINKVSWIPTRKPPRVPKSNVVNAGTIFGPNYLPGDYKVKVVKGEASYETIISISHNPDSPHSQEDQDLQMQKWNEAYNLLEDLAYLDRRITDAMEQSDKLAGNATLSPSLKRKLSAFTAELTEIRKKLLVTKVGDIRGEQQLREKVSELYGAIGDYYGRPTQSQIERLADLSVEADNMKATVDAIFTKNLASLNQQIGKASLAPIKILTREEFDAEGQE